MNRRCRFCVTLLPVLLFGCTSLEAVRKYSEVTQATIQEVQPIAHDFHASCMRANIYKPSSAHSECEGEEQASLVIRTIAGVLNNYAVALGALASDGLVDYKADIGALTGEIRNLHVKGLDEKKIGAVGSLATVIANASTKLYQQKQIAQFVRESDPAVVSVSNTLSRLIKDNYAEAIREEITAWGKGYKRIEINVRDKRPLEWEQYSKEQWDVRVNLEAKLKASVGLAEAVTDIGATHQKLSQDANELTTKEVAAAVSAFVNKATPVIREVKDAF